MLVKMIKKKDKRGMELEVLGYWILGIAALVIIVVGYIYFKSKGVSAIDFVKNVFRVGV
jgi:hypothetical protein